MMIGTKDKKRRKQKTKHVNVRTNCLIDQTVGLGNGLAVIGVCLL
jgi:hypothetical protein